MRQIDESLYYVTKQFGFRLTASKKNTPTETSNLKVTPQCEKSFSCCRWRTQAYYNGTYADEIVGS